jgi:hypothetical protein
METNSAITYEQHEPGSEALDAPEWLPSGSTKAYGSPFVQVQVVDGFTPRELAA